MPDKMLTYIPLEASIIHCKADSEPPPMYEWFKFGKPFNYEANSGRYTKYPGEGTLVLARPQSDDDGIYQCVAKNDLGIALSNMVVVRRAEMGAFPDKNQKMFHLGVSDRIRLDCDVPLNYPPPVVTWQILRNNDQLEYIKETNRHATDLDGNLHIAAVDPKDNMAAYQCVANNAVMRKQMMGPINLLMVTGDKNRRINQKMTTMFTYPKQQLALEGDTLELKCFFSGFPLPRYEWFKDDQQITLPNVQIKNIGTMLEFKPVTVESAGSYRCQATNEVTMSPYLYEFVVIVRRRPKFVNFPTDQNVPVGGSAVFDCTADADPPASVKWTVNGLDPNQYLDGIRKRIEGTKMILTNLTIGDIAVIQCNASNTHGYAYTNAFINVMREPPFFVMPPAEEVRVTEGKPINITCQTFSAPPAIISWNKDGRPINGGRYQSMMNGDLFIESASVTDSGVYECVATNPFGETKASGRLTVRRKTRVVLAPYNTRIYEGDLIKFVCTAETDPNELENLQVTWYKDDNLINLEQVPRVGKIWFDYSFAIGGVQPRDTGQYICNVSNGLDFDWATASLLVQGIPDQPKRVTVECPSNDNVGIVTWYPGSDNYSPIIEFIIEVRTKNRVGISEPSESVDAADTCTQPSAVPDTNPMELYVYGRLETELTVQWTAMPYIEHNGAGLYYQLTVQCNDCNNMPSGAIVMQTISDWRQDRYTFFGRFTGTNRYNIENYKNYSVSIRAYNENGASKGRVTTAWGFSGEQAPGLTAGALTVINTTSTGAILQWTVLRESDLTNLAGFFRGYRIEWCPATVTQTQCQQNIRFQDVIFRIPKTPVLYGFAQQPAAQTANTRFRRSAVLPADESLNLPVYNKFRVKRQSPAQPQRHSCDMRDLYTHDHPMCDFKEPIYLTKQPRSHTTLIETADLMVKRSARQVTDPATTMPLPVGSSERTSVFDGLTVPFQYGASITQELFDVPGNTKVTAWLRVLTSVWAGRHGPSVDFTTKEGIPGPVSDLRVYSIGVNTVNTSWTAPVDPNGVLNGYLFGIEELRELEMGQTSYYPVVHDGTLTNYQFTGLRPNTTYRLYVHPMTSAGKGLDNFIDVVTNPVDAAPNPPSFFVQNIQNDSLEIVYEPSRTGLPGSYFYGQYRQPGVIWWEETEPNFIVRSFFVQNLTEDTEYEVRVVSTNGAQMSSAANAIRIRTTGTARPGGIVGASATWFIILFLLFLALIAFFALLILARKKRFNKLQQKTEVFREKSLAATGSMAPSRIYQPPSSHGYINQSRSVVGPGMGGSMISGYKPAESMLSNRTPSQGFGNNAKPKKNEPGANFTDDDPVSFDRPVDIPAPEEIEQFDDRRGEYSKLY
ncbi:hypothetical protein Ciccas_002299 [Cichlidogyrus casuarinus]|uniref:Neuroglian n=1 Tax=Cichlidogyrus casuarinus TaxID=1844966 RepID=A0ABD2QHN1_9PLAT